MTPRPRIACILGFSITCIVGFVITCIVRDKALAGLPGTEIYEAIHRDSMAFAYTCAGWFLTLITAFLAGIVLSNYAAKRATREQS